MPRDLKRCAQWRADNIAPKHGDDRRQIHSESASNGDGVQSPGVIVGVPATVAEARSLRDGSLTLHEQKTKAEIEKIDQEIRQKRVKADQLEGKVVDRGEALQQARIIFAALRTRMLYIPEEMAMELTPEQRKRMLSRIELALKEMKGFRI